MNNFRICDILNALTDMKLTYPASYDSIIPHLKSMIEEDERDLWVCRVVNTDPTGQPGHHYNHVVYGINSEGVPWATYLEPLANLSISIHISETLRKEVPNVQIEHIPVKVQDDGHSCGYISVWWQIHCQLLVNRGSVPLKFEPPTELLSFHFPVPFFLFSHKIVSFNVCQSEATTSFVLYLEVECLGMLGN